MGISIEHAIKRRRRVQVVQEALLKRGWSVAAYSPGTSLNGRILDKWLVTVSHLDSGHDVEATGITEEGARIDAYAKAYKCESANDPAFSDLLNEATAQ